MLCKGERGGGGVFGFFDVLILIYNVLIILNKVSIFFCILVNVKVCSIRVVVCLDFLMFFVDFFISGFLDFKFVSFIIGNVYFKGIM